MNKTVCIVTPGQIGSNPRVVKEAQALTEAGFHVKVIATKSLAIVEYRDQSIISGGISWSLERIDLSSRFFWKMRRLHQVFFRFVYRMIRSTYFADYGLSSYTMALRNAILETPADLYIAHYPAALPVACEAAQRYRAIYAYDAEDFHLGEVHENCSIERSLIYSIESRYLPKCAYITAASPGIARAYKQTYEIDPPHVILNVFPIDQAPKESTKSGKRDPGPSVYWFSQTIGPDRGLECAVKAIGLAVSKPHLYLRGSLSPGYASRLRSLAIESGVENRVHILEPDVPYNMEKLAADFDLGLAAETNCTLSRNIALTNKVFSYLLAGLPPILSNTDAQKEFAWSNGLRDHLYSIDNFFELAELIDRFLLDPRRLAIARQNAYELGQNHFNWARESRTLLIIVNKALAEN